MRRAGQALTTKDGRIRSPRERLREKIRLGMMIDRLDKCANGEIEMTATQLNAAKFLINKLIADAPAPKHEDPLAHAKDITHADPHRLLTVIEGNQ
jgi:hypothetical protein